MLRTPIRSSRMPDSIRQATVAIEDRRFYKHRGVDFEGVVRAAIKNISSGETVEGGSTLTMQLVQATSTRRTATDRARGLQAQGPRGEARLGARGPAPGPEGKAWILTQYLNNVPYGTVGGQTAVGIEAAARIFFDKPARRLTLTESALLAGLPQAPSRYNPFLDPGAALARRNEVLAADGRRGLHRAARPPRARSDAPLGVKKGRYYAKRARELLLRLRQAAADRRVRRQRACARAG